MSTVIEEWEDANPGWAAGIVAETPLGRLNEVGDVVAAVIWRMSDDADFASGEVLTVNGAFVTSQT